MSFEYAFVTYAYLPDGSTRTVIGTLPAENGDPDIGVNAPVLELIRYADMSFP